jgi:hypothetical protein
MSMSTPQLPPEANGAHAPSGTPHEAISRDLLVDSIPDDEDLRRELENLARENQQLLAAMGLRPLPAEDAPAEEFDPLAAENRELRARIAGLEQQLEASGSGQRDWTEQQKDYEVLLEEKSEVIRVLHQQMQKLREGGVPEGGSVAVGGDFDARHQQLEELRVKLEGDRAQLQQDEAALMTQMTQMEMTMSRERAELARQRAELQRLHSDIRHELEMAGRDASLRDRLATFKRRHQEASGRKGTGTAVESTPESPPESSPSPVLTPPPKKSGSSILRRLFGAGNA